MSVINTGIYFKWPDYLVFSLSLVLSAAIGFYYACTGGKQKTTKEYLLADRNMHWLPVAISLAVSFTSSGILIGLPAEIYTFGTIYMFTLVGRPIAAVLSAKLFIPVFKQIGSISLYQYIYKRFGRVLSIILLVEGFVLTMLFGALIIYGPALAMSGVTGLNLWIAVCSVGLIAMLYTVLGGLKAVLWTDTLQFLIMIVGCIVLLIFGTVKAGGPSEVWRVNKLSGRLDILEPTKFLSIDPRSRHTLWTQVCNAILICISAYGASPIAIQRILALKPGPINIFLCFTTVLLITFSFQIICAAIGLVAFTYYKTCDPVASGVIFSKDQIQPLFTMEIFQNLPGLSGLLMSSVFSASLSTISSAMNAGAAIILQEVIKPLKPNMSDQRATVICKMLSTLTGIVSILFVIFLRLFGNGLLSVTLALVGIATGPSVAVFTVGIIFPFVDGRCAVIGNVIATAFTTWLSFGGLINRPYVYSYPVTTAGCNITDENLLANISSPVYDPSTWNPQSHYRYNIYIVFSFNNDSLGYNIVIAFF
ncbi:hypothetical protein EB796_014024 [Bugula neritina]|uniref:SLC5A6 n=1 Tax=Bugula neritina TaxID=10212 RepID=A0A7J7JQE0_BUGNE|nr:hypothetical protein EB796_014024 [Bugula neritina]